MLRPVLRTLAAVVLGAALCLALCLTALAEPLDSGSFAAEIPLSGVLALLSNSKSVRLMTVADGAYTIEFSKISTGDSDFWVRAVLAKGEIYYGTLALGSRADLEAIDTLLLECEAEDGFCQLSYLALPSERVIASAQLPLELGGALLLTEHAETLGVYLRPAEALPQPADEVELPPAEFTQPVTAKVPPGAYAAAIASLFLLLGILVLGQIYALRLRRIFDSLRQSAGGFMPKKPVKQIEIVPAELPPKDAPPAPLPPPSDAMPVLSGVKVVPEAEGGSLRKRIVVQGGGVEASPHSEEARMNSYFLGNVFFTPLEHSFLSVGLRNRDALLQTGGAQLQPLFAPSPKGHVFSLEEDSGNLYLNIHYYAPPSFVVQSALRSACVDRVFSLEDKDGQPLRLEAVMGHAIIGIVPARTRRGDNGYVLTEKGRLIIGDN